MFLLPHSNFFTYYLYCSNVTKGLPKTYCTICVILDIGNITINRCVLILDRKPSSLRCLQFILQLVSGLELEEISKKAFTVCLHDVLFNSDAKDLSKIGTYLFTLLPPF